MATEVAATVIVVDSKGDVATRFYESFGFISLPKLSNRMFLPIGTVEKLDIQEFIHGDAEMFNRQRRS